MTIGKKIEHDQERVMLNFHFCKRCLCFKWENSIHEECVLAQVSMLSLNKLCLDYWQEIEQDQDGIRLIFPL